MGEKYPALRYSDKMVKDFQNGILTVECNSWNEFEAFTKKFNQCKFKYLWRGQSSEKLLWPNIYRDTKPNKREIERHLNKFKKDMPEAVALEQFLERAKKEGIPEFEKAFSEYIKMINPKEKENNPKANYEKDFIDAIYWSIGQHHGLLTPLLDWTLDPYKALFFAFCKKKENDNKRIVFGLAEKTRRLLKGEKRYIMLLNNLDFVKRILDASDNLTDLKERIGPMFDRIQEQNGMFTQSLRIENIEKHAERCYRKFIKEPRKDKIVFLIRIMIPDSFRENFLKKLERKKITYKTMFPDLQGSSLHCNLKLLLRTKA